MCLSQECERSRWRPDTPSVQHTAKRTGSPLQFMRRFSRGIIDILKIQGKGKEIYINCTHEDQTTHHLLFLVVLTLSTNQRIGQNSFDTCIIKNLKWNEAQSARAESTHKRVN